MIVKRRITSALLLVLVVAACRTTEPSRAAVTHGPLAQTVGADVTIQGSAEQELYIACPPFSNVSPRALTIRRVTLPHQSGLLVTGEQAYSIRQTTGYVYGGRGAAPYQPLQVRGKVVDRLLPHPLSSAVLPAHSGISDWYVLVTVRALRPGSYSVKSFAVVYTQGNRTATEKLRSTATLVFGR